MQEEQLRAAALEYHEFPRPGKISIAPTKSLANQRELSLAYSPGVAYACLAIRDDPALIAERRKNEDVAYLFEAAAAYAPRRVVKDGLLIEAGGLRLDVFHPGHAHTPGDLCVYAASLGVLASGDLVSTGYHPNLEDADVAGMRAALSRLKSLPFWTLVPGHGPAGGREGVDDQLAYLEAAEQVVVGALRDGSEEDACVAIARRFPDFRLEIVLPALVARFRLRTASGEARGPG